MNKITISRLELNEVDQFFDLFKNIGESNFEKWSSESKNKWFNENYSLEFWKDLLKSGKLPVHVAKDNSKMVGYVVVEGINFGVAYIGWIGILKEYQKHKIGGLLMSAIELWCLRNDIHKIELETQEPGLKYFYEKQGYVLEGIRKNSWQNLDNYMFGKSLNVTP